MSHRQAKRRRATMVNAAGVTCTATLLGGMTPAAWAQTAPTAMTESAGSSIQEIVVTATRRSQSIIDVPYNISAISGADLVARGVTSISDLTRAVPGLSLVDTGPQFAGTTGQLFIIRGLNATSVGAPIAAEGQAPVATYYGETPLFIYYPMTDLERVEVLRGPQGTLFGAGSLSGAVRFIPNLPQLREDSLEVMASAADQAHSENGNYDASAIFNVSAHEAVAIRGMLGYTRNAGYIDALGLFKRANSGWLAPAVASGGANLATPPILAPQNGVNDQEIMYGRIAVLVEPSDRWHLTVAYNRVESKGSDSNDDNPAFHGGPYQSVALPLPGINLPSSGEYEQVQSGLRPWIQTAQVASADVEVDLGFATLTSNTSYYEKSSRQMFSNDLNKAPYAPYYMGAPRYPGWLSLQYFPIDEHGATEEIRLVSPKGEHFDWVAGGYYSRKRSESTWTGNTIGMEAWKAFSGSPYPAGFVGPDEAYSIARQATDQESAAFGELTYHITHLWQATVGARWYRTSSDATQQFLSNGFPGPEVVLDSSESIPYSGTLWKFDTSYALGEQRVYATWSQGFRSGGANSYPTAASSPVAEPAQYIAYKPDFVNNYEIGLKGKLAPRLTYTTAVFYDMLRDTQIELLTPVNGWPAVINGGQAVSKGVEFEFDGDITSGLRANISYAYADARLTQSFVRNFSYGQIIGQSGDRLIGSAESNFGATLNYDHHLAVATDLRFMVSGNYKGPVALALPQPGSTQEQTVGGYALFDSSITLIRGSMSAGIFANNLTNKRAVMAESLNGVPVFPQALGFYTNRPRVIGIRVSYQL
jgi:iron complex outermembrane recepter protein